MKYFLNVAVFIFVFNSYSQEEKKADFCSYKAYDYLISKYENFDIVILGEHHWIKNELKFLKKSIPVLYENGVKCFAFEFLAFTAQEHINNLINSDTFSKSLLDSVISEKSHWYVKEYLNILHTLWSLNQKNKDVIVLGLDVPNNFPLTINNDSIMADIAINYYSDTKNKMLIYCGRNHGLTKFYQCKLNNEKVDRLGNIIYRNFPNQVTNIVFFPLLIENEADIYHKFSYKLNSKKSFGMDLNNSPISNNKEGDYYLQRSDNYSIGNFYDGAIFINKKSKPCKRLKNNIDVSFEDYKKIKKIIKETDIIYFKE